jgi:hypothetical protein
MAAAQITPPGPSEDARKLWRKVAECIDAVNAIQNMTVVIEGKVHMQGKLTVSGGSSLLKITDAKEVTN